MYNLSTDTSDIFRVPDYRECVLVGIGQNTTDTIATHDEYTLGQFKDDQLQSHTHTRGTMNITGYVNKVRTKDTDLPSGGAFQSTLLTSNLQNYWDGIRNSNAANISFDASRSWSGATSAPSGRTDTTTHGKQKGVNYIIKY